MAMEAKHSKILALKNAISAKMAMRGAMIVLVALMAWYQFGGVEADMLAEIKADAGALVHSARTFLATSFSGEKLSTGPAETVVETDRIDATWQFKKAAAGESVWSVYREAIKGNTEIAFQAQVINGLKNITLIQNAIGQERVDNNSLAADQEYSFLNDDAIMVYAGKVKEANEKLKSGATLSDLSPDVQMAYQLANAPSYQFLYSLSVDTLHSAYQ